MKSVALYFGSFNPIHQGHIKIAMSLLDVGLHDEVWFVISPQNPFKKVGDLAQEQHRYQIASLSLQNYIKLKVCDIEFGLPKPSYTIQTLDILALKYPDIRFSILMGEDNWRVFHLWKDAEKIIQNFSLFVYPRLASSSQEVKSPFSDADIFYFEAPLLPISSTQVRENPFEALQKGFIDKKVYEYIRAHDLYISSI